MNNSTGTSGAGEGARAGATASPQSLQSAERSPSCASFTFAVAGSISPSSSITASPSTSTSTGSASPASIIERRNRRRSSALSGAHPADVPLTASDQQLSDTIAKLNFQNARDAASTSSTLTPPPKLPQPALTVSRLHLEADSARNIEEPSLSSEKTPTQASFRHLSSERAARTVIRSHARHGSICTTTFRLSAVEDETDTKTPTNTNRIGRLSPIQGEDQLSPSLPPVRGEQALPVNGNTELSPRQSYPEVQLSPYRLFTRRMYTRSPLDSPASLTEDEDTEQCSPGEEVDSGDAAESSDTDDVSDPESPLEPFPPYEEN